MMTVRKNAPSFPAPKAVNALNDAGLGKWYAGAEQSGTEKPVLVFVPGLGQPAASWWGEDEFYGFNEMYRKAYGAGFRTAFVGFSPPGKKPYDMWQNGRILAWQLKDICRYFGVKSVSLIAHSKGGVDSETAMVYHGAAERVRRLITLSTPHWGSQLADIAYSPAGWHLAERIGAHSDGCYVMQTEYMKEFRQLTGSQEPKPLCIGTMAGSGRGPAFTSLWAGSLMMDRYGPNDGVVTVESAHHPAGIHLATPGFNHSQMRMGQFIWPYIESALEGRAEAAPAMAAPALRDCGGILRGGKLDRGMDEPIPVDSTAESMTVGVTATGTASFRLISPSKKEYSDFAVQRLKNGNRICQITVDMPERGTWKLKSAKSKGAYLAFVCFYGSNRMLCLHGKCTPPEGTGHFKENMRILKIFPDRYELVGDYERKDPAQDLPLNLRGGLYKIEADVTGELKDGSLFDRTVIRTMLVNPQNADARTFLKGIYGRNRYY